jgi:hypothetical protein
MSEPGKPDPARGWRFVEKLLAEEGLERLDKASDEEVERQMRAQGVQTSRVPSAEELLEKAAARAKRRQAKGTYATIDADRAAKVVATPVPPKRVRWVPILAAAAMGAVGVAVAVNRPGEDAAGGASARARAAKLRDEGIAACAAAEWTACEERLDGARALDEEGEKDPRVIAARKAMKEAGSGGGGGKR